MRGFTGRRTFIGLDIGGHDVKAVQSLRTRRGWKLAACARFPRSKADAPVSSEELSEVMAVLHRQGFIGNKVAVAASSEKLLSGVLELPARRPDVPMEQIARAEFGRIHKCDVATAEFSWWELPAPARAGKATNVMAIALQHADARQQLEIFDRAGVTVGALDTASSALGRTCLALAPAAGALAALDFGWRGATLVLVRNGMVAYERRISTGGLSSLHATLGSRLGLDAAAVEQVIQQVGLSGDVKAESSEIALAARPLMTAHLDEIVQEVRKTLGYAQHQYPDAPVQLMFLAGGGACISGIVQHFQTALEIEVRSAEPAFLSEGNPSRRQRMSCSHASAAGLAMFLN